MTLAQMREFSKAYDRRIDGESARFIRHVNMAISAAVSQDSAKAVENLCKELDGL